MLLKGHREPNNRIRATLMHFRFVARVRSECPGPLAGSAFPIKLSEQRLLSRRQRQYDSVLPEVACKESHLRGVPTLITRHNLPDSRNWRNMLILSAVVGCRTPRETNVFPQMHEDGVKRPFKLFRVMFLGFWVQGRHRH